jgi:hypothetical protein
MFLAFIGICGLLMLLLAFENYRKSGNVKLRAILMIFAMSSLGFVAYNWIGYYQIIRINEVQIIGEFQTEDGKVKLTVNENHTWEIYADSNPHNQSGSWNYFMSENLDIWEFKLSEDDNKVAQTLSPDLIEFDKFNIQFQRVK